MWCLDEIQNTADSRLNHLTAGCEKTYQRRQVISDIRASAEAQAGGSDHSTGRAYLLLFRKPGGKVVIADHKQFRVLLERKVSPLTGYMFPITYLFSICIFATHVKGSPFPKKRRIQFLKTQPKQVIQVSVERAD